MSDTTTATPTPADIAPKTQGPAQAPADTDAPTPEKPQTSTWDELFRGEDPAEVRKALDESRKWERRAKDNRTDAEKAAERLAEIEQRAVAAEARAVRRDIALEHNLSREDAALLDNLTDEAAMKALAVRLAGESDKKRNHVPREGNNPTTSGDDRRDFVRRLTGRD